MNPKQIGKQVMDFSKAAFHTYFNTMCSLQDRSEKALDTLLTQSPFFSADAKKQIASWIKAYKQGRDNCKTVANAHFGRMEGLFNGDLLPK
jgi:hypothetical protein